MNKADFCLNCGSILSENEIAMHKKLIGRYSENFLCTECIAEKFGVTPELIREKTQYFIKSGCTLFPDNR